ncbi:L,D-transpeptidase [Paenibacillus lautus]|uniref:L,D-transpeptidase n=1 Tax=Paenibacillus lautus TaxID=1401 RepID=UPI003D9A5E26
MNNSLYLKRYVETHPDNKMAWYLLGKEYEQAGEQGKANYCYNKAEGVYEAFELSQVPSDIWKNYEHRLLEMEKDKERKRKRTRRLLAALVLLLLVFLPPAQAPGSATGNLAEDLFPPHEPASANALNKEKPDSRKEPLYTAVPSGQGKDSAGALSSLLQHPQQLPNWSVALGMKRSGKWLLWSRDMERLYGLHRNDRGAIAIQPYEGAAEDCDCEPADSSRLKRSAGQWADLQVETAVLQEAAKQYKARHGRLPKSLDELTQPFPSNWLSGRSKAMEQMFETLMQQQSQGAGGQGQPGQQPGNSSEEPGYWGTSPNGAPFFEQPLQVIIDRKRHRLAVVSGGILLRNYEVGLGGAKTPLGDFHINDKVVNPNGTTKGPYGTRGMQLSDTLYAIHGTLDVDSIGANESEGCIRMLTEDVEELFDLVPMGTAVKIREGVLPEDLWTPKERFKLKHTQGQTNPGKVYHWLD